MLTEKQVKLIDLLEIPLNEFTEDMLRNRHAMVRELGFVKKPLTGWLEDCLKAKWRNENKRIYLGD
jgi:hypothetical protein